MISLIRFSDMAGTTTLDQHVQLVLESHLLALMPSYDSQAIYQCAPVCNYTHSSFVAPLMMLDL